MQQAFITMLDMQDAMNRRVHPEWRRQNYAWYRALWVECAELMDHHGYKWWKAQTPDWAQVQMEVVDIWHFGLSDLLLQEADSDALAARLASEAGAHAPAPLSLLEATEALAARTLAERRFSFPDFLSLMHAADLSLESLYTRYVGKNVLNFFRQDKGYKEGSYRKDWHGREDNEHLQDLLDELDAGSASFPEDLYAALDARYASVA